MEEEDCEITTEYVDPSLLMGPEQLDDLCRLCANTDSQLMPIFSGEGLEHKIQNKIEEHLPIIAVTEFDRLPLSICYHCASSLIAWHNLYEGCKIADSRLRKLLGEDIKLEDEDTQYEETYEAYNLEDGEEEEEEEEELEEDEENIEQHNLLDNIMQLSPTTGTLRPADIEYNNSVVDDAIQEALNTSELIETEGDVVINTEECIIDSEGIEVRSLTEEEILKTVPDPIVKSFEIRTSKDRPYFCNTCGFTFKRQDHVKSHKRWVHDRIRDCNFECNLCGKVLKTPSGISQHMLRHKGEKPFVCEYCDKKFYSNCYLLKHYQNHLEQSSIGGYIPCTMCDNKYSTERQLKFHMLWHNMTHVCNICQKRFETKKQLYCHMRRHNEHKPFRCNDCNERFQLMKSLVAHKKKHLISGQKRLPEPKKPVSRSFRCDICNLTYKNEITFNKHRREHFSDRDYHCDVCEISYTTSGTFNEHMTQHTIQQQEQNRFYKTEDSSNGSDAAAAAGIFLSSTNAVDDEDLIMDEVKHSMALTSSAEEALVDNNNRLRNDNSLIRLQDGGQQHEQEEEEEEEAEEEIQDETLMVDDSGDQFILVTAADGQFGHNDDIDTDENVVIETYYPRTSDILTHERDDELDDE